MAMSDMSNTIRIHCLDPKKSLVVTTNDGSETIEIYRIHEEKIGVQHFFKATGSDKNKIIHIHSKNYLWEKQPALYQTIMRQVGRFGIILNNSEEIYKTFVSWMEIPDKTESK